jgi:hypothetical protein
MHEGYLYKMLRLIFIISQFITIAVVAWSFFQIRSCALEGTRKADPVNLECGVPNEVREAACPQGEAGRKLEVCKDGSWQESFNDCKAGGCSEITFDQSVKPMLTAKCAGCHPGYDGYETAKAKVEQFIGRVNLDDNNALRMPKPPNPPLAKEDKDLLAAWKKDGLLKACAVDQTNNAPHLDLDYVERAIDEDLDKLNLSQQADSRYLITSHKSNEGAAKDTMRQFKNGVNKAVNSLSLVRNLVLASAVDEHETVYRISLRSLGLKPADWKLIEDNEVVGIVSVTNRGQLIRNLTRTRKPWLHVDSFAFTSNQARIYYAVRKLPENARDLFLQLGVNFNGDLNDLEVLQVGFENSPISLNKNRLLGRWQSNDGSFWASFDVAQNQGGNTNLFQFPLLLARNRANNFAFVASEAIFSLPNGLHGYYLFDNKGVRADAAPLNIVSDNVSPFSPEIKNSLSCYRCHSAGLIPAKDQIKAHVLTNATEFDLNDVETVEQLYREPEPIFLEDNGQYQAALSKIGIVAAEEDPVNLVGDNLRRNHNAKAVASLLLLTEQEFLDGLARSAEGRAQVGQLLSGGSVNFEQLIASLPVLIKDLRIGQEDLTP